jgi:uncharacterized damage-inducible protein DinB
MQLQDFKATFLREVAALGRELDLYPDESSVWKELPGLPNSAGTLVLHLAGNLQHFLGATLGGTGYARDREAEFTNRGVPRKTIKKELEQTRQAVITTFSKLTEEKLKEPFPALKHDLQLSTQQMLFHLLSHLAYHLGQIDYHRRAVTGDATSAHTLPLAELASKL